jgi:hypothetical protein
MWEDVKADLPFMRASGPVESLEHSPFETLDQLSGYIESYAQSNRSVRLLARGTTDSVGQSLDRLMRYNISPKYHFTRSGAGAAREAEVLMDNIMDMRSAPVLDPRLTDIFSLAEDRLKSWYELMHRLDSEDEQIALDEMRRDIHEFIRDELSRRKIKVKDAMISSTGSHRLDDLKTQLLFMCGWADISELWPKMSSVSIWNNPEKLEGGRYSGDYEVIRKRDDLTIKITKAGTAVRAKANRPERSVKEVFRKVVFDSIDFDQLKIPNGRVIGLSNIKGTRMMVIECEDRLRRYMSLPNAQMRLLHPKKQLREWPIFVEAWLTRSAINKNELESMVDVVSDRGIWGSLSRSIIRTCKTLNSNKDLIQMQERVAAAPKIEKPIEEVIAGLMELADMLDTGEPPEMEFDDYMMHGWGDGYKLEEAGLEAFSLEPSYTALEINRSLKTLSVQFDLLSKLPQRYLADHMVEAIRLYNETEA